MREVLQYYRKIQEKVGLNQNIFKTLKNILGLLLIFGILNTLFHRINFSLFENLFSNLGWGLLGGLLFITSILNVSIEAIKWKILVNNVKRIHFFEAVKHYCSAQAYQMLLPSWLGDYFGRFTYFKLNDLGKLIPVGFINSVGQTLSTFLYFSIAYSLNHSFKSITSLYLIIFSVFSVVIYLVAFQNKNFKIYKFKFSVALKKSQILSNLLFSSSKLLLITSQYALVFYLLSLKIEWSVLVLGLSYYFISKTFSSSLHILLSFGLSQVISMAFFSNYGLTDEQILFVNSIIFVFNNFLPALFGLFCYFQKDKI
jgi:hypothetical protein